MRWSNQPPTQPDTFALRIIRTPKEQSLDAIITCPEITGCYTHFIHNRTVPCEGSPECEHCQNGHSHRWHGYVSCILVKTFEHVLFEFTAIAGQTFTNFREVHQTLRCCRFKARRPSGRHNGRIVIACTLHDATHGRIPDPPNIRNILCHIWNVQNSNVEQRSDRPHAGHQIIPLPSKADGRYRSAHSPK